mmetsp:Transcript_12287/g.18524  ORF Transcript_12287/g.18524 Transcript_12287/m.18524 type:complete len:221 (-) Transcript_12287:3276-3938(-)
MRSSKTDEVFASRLFSACSSSTSSACELLEFITKVSRVSFSLVTSVRNSFNLPTSFSNVSISSAASSNSSPLAAASSKRNALSSSRFSILVSRKPICSLSCKTAMSRECFSSCSTRSPSLLEVRCSTWRRASAKAFARAIFSSLTAKSSSVAASNSFRRWLRLIEVCSLQNFKEVKVSVGERASSPSWCWNTFIGVFNLLPPLLSVLDEDLEASSISCME